MALTMVPPGSTQWKVTTYDPILILQQVRGSGLSISAFLLLLPPCALYSPSFYQFLVISWCINVFVLLKAPTVLQHCASQHQRALGTVSLEGCSGFGPAPVSHSILGLFSH